MMKSTVLALALGWVALPVAAECLTAASLDSGIVFARADGRKGSVVRSGDGINIDYATGDGPWTDERETLLGIYETKTVQYYQDDPDAVGGGARSATRVFPRKTATPEAGGGWTGKVRLDVWQSNSSEAGGYGYKDKLTASYAFLPEKTVKISGCSYRVIPVEASFVSGDGGASQRWLYFADLGFGLETRVDGVDNGVTALKAK